MRRPVPASRAVEPSISDRIALATAWPSSSALVRPWWKGRRCSRNGRARRCRPRWRREVVHGPERLVEVHAPGLDRRRPSSPQAARAARLAHGALREKRREREVGRVQRRLARRLDEGVEVDAVPPLQASRRAGAVPAAQPVVAPRAAAPRPGRRGAAPEDARSIRAARWRSRPRTRPSSPCGSDRGPRPRGAAPRARSTSCIRRIA